MKFPSVSRVTDLFSVPATQRPPDYRYRQAIWDAENRWFVRPSDSSYDYCALTVCLGRVSSAVDDSQRRAALEHPHCNRFRNLLAIHRDREQASRLEAMVLARYWRPRIARRTGLSEDAVATYEHLFFDVRPLKQIAEYIVRFAIVPEGRLGAHETVRRRVAMKALAYFCGPKALEELFFMPTFGPGNYWRHPAEVVQQLRATQLIDGVADLFLASSRSPNPRTIAEQIDALRNALRERFGDAWPADDIIWEVQRPGSPFRLTSPFSPPPHAAT